MYVISFIHIQINIAVRLCACTWDVIGEYCGYPDSAAWFSSAFQPFYEVEFHKKNYHRFLPNPLSS